jgi:N-acetylglutamate synthase-like GNAT family acetyltransferase
MQPSITIRPALIEDAAAISQLVIENANSTLLAHYNAEQWKAFISYYTIEEVEANIKTIKVFCALVDNNIVGTIALDIDFVIGFYTRLQNIGQGVGKHLLTFIENYAANNGIKKLQLAASPAGAAFYLKKGWQIIEELDMFYKDVPFRETLMEKAL